VSDEQLRDWRIAMARQFEEACGVPRCRDFDEDCHDVHDKLRCYLCDPAKGYCPYLRAEDG
jgi:hypothetical protein